MAVRGYRDSHGRQRYLGEFQQRGRRILRRAPPNVTQAQARDWETQIRRSLFDQKTLGKRPPLLLSEVIQSWLNTKPQKHMRDLTNKANALAPFVKGKTVEQAPEVAERAVQTWTAKTADLSGKTTDARSGPRSASTSLSTGGRARPIGRTLTPSTINRRLCVLKGALKWAYKQGLTDHNLSARISLRRGERQKEVYLTRAQVSRLASCVQGPTRSAIMLMAYAGLRASECLSLTPTSLRRGTILVETSKSGKPRIIPVPSLLRSHLAGLPLGLSYWQLRDGFIEARKKAGLGPEVTLHTLRHSYASWLINAGVDLYTVGKLLGHSGPQTTKRYAHLQQSTLAKAVRKL